MRVAGSQQEQETKFCELRLPPGREKLIYCTKNPPDGKKAAVQTSVTVPKGTAKITQKLRFGECLDEIVTVHDVVWLPRDLCQDSKNILMDHAQGMWLPVFEGRECKIENTWPPQNFCVPGDLRCSPSHDSKDDLTQNPNLKSKCETELNGQFHDDMVAQL